MIVFYLILLTISVIFYIMYIGIFSYYLMMFMITLPIILFALDLYFSRKLKVYFTKGVQKVTGKAVVDLEIVAENPTPFPVANLEIIIEYQNSIDKKTNTTRIYTPIMPKEAQSMRLDISPFHTGAISFKFKKCRVYDFLRLFKFKLRGKGYKECLKNSTLFVLPQYVNLDNPIMNYSVFGSDCDEYSADKKGDDPSQIFDIHQYTEGDKLNRVHWKLSAKQDTLMVKDYSLPLTYAVKIFINLNTNDQKCYDAILGSSMSVSMALTQAHSAHCISWYDKDAQSLRSFNIKQEQEHIDCADMLIRTKTYTDENINIYPFVDNDYQTSYAHLLVVSKPLGEEEIEAIAKSEHAAKYTFVFALDDNQQLQSPVMTDNVNIIYVHRDHIADAFSDIVF